MSEENKKSYRGIVMVISVTIVIPVLYLLSIGPVAAISHGFPPGKDAVRQFYSLIIWLHERTVLRKPLDLYVGLWGTYYYYPD